MGRFSYSTRRLDRLVANASESGNPALWPEIAEACAAHPARRYTVLWHLPFYWRDHVALVGPLILESLAEPKLRDVALAAAAFPALLENVVGQLHATKSSAALREEVTGCLAAMLGEVGSPSADFECAPEARKAQLTSIVDKALRTRFGVRLADLIETDCSATGS